MKRVVTILMLLAVCTGRAIAESVPKPLSIDEKVKRADLIVLGTASGFDELDSRLSLRIKVKEILWPASTSNISEIVLAPPILGGGTDISGVFFLNRSTLKEGQWSLPANRVLDGTGNKSL
jgi:hypothetical protein